MSTHRLADGTVQVGDVLVEHFGYEAHLVTFWKVVAKTAATVRLSRVAANRKAVAGGGWCYEHEETPSNHELGQFKSCRICKDGRVRVNANYTTVYTGDAEITYNAH